MSMSIDLLKEPLPEPWTFGVTKDGRVFFINDEEQTTTWLHPDTGQPAMTGYQRTLDLPSGWERGFAPDGPMYFINHNDRTTTFTHPEELEKQTKDDATPTTKRKKRRPSFSDTLTRPLFRRSSSKHRTKVEKVESKVKRSSSARRSSQSLNRSTKMTVVRRDPRSVVTKSGWLYKQDSSGVGGMKMWRKRWFVLCDFCLFYYKDLKEEEVLGSIVLPSYDISTINAGDKVNRKYAFKIEHQGMRTYYISAESYKEMAEWITALTPTCSLQPNASKSGSKKANQSKEVVNVKPTNDDAQFGFGESRQAPKKQEKPVDSAPSTPSSDGQKPVANGNNNNAKLSTSSSVSQPDGRLARQQSRNSQKSRNSHRTRSSTSSRTHNSTSAPGSRYRSSTEPAMPRPYDQRMITSARDPMVYAQQNGEPYYIDMSSTHDGRRDQSSKVQRHNSMVKLGDWVQKQKQQSTSTINSHRRHPDTMSELSSVSSPHRKTGHYYQPVQGTRSRPHYHPPSSGKRYKPGSYNDYMDPTEVASSIMSVPPIYRNNRVMSLPRPRSTQELDEQSNPRRRRIPNSKSTSYLEPVGSGPPMRTKSDYSLAQPIAVSPPSQRSSSQRTPSSINTPRRPVDDVFSPMSPNGHFHYDVQPISELSPPTSADPSKSNYEIKQMDVKGKQGQLRAFAVSLKQNAPDVIPSKATQNLSSDFEKLSTNESDIEAKLDRLNELDNTLHNLTNEMNSLQNNKLRLERSLIRAKTSFTGEGSAIELEGKLSNVKSLLAESAAKLKAMTKENEAFEKEIRQLKSKLLEQLGQSDRSTRPSSKQSQRQLEWELGKVELMMEGVNKNKIGLVNKLEVFNDVDSKPSSPSSRSSVGRNGSGKNSAELRSPRNVKRISTERRTPGGTGFTHMRSASSSSSLSHDGGKYYTLPGHGVSHASSVDSLTAATLMRSPRPSSARSGNLHRTKSAAERLLHSSYGNLSSQDPDEIKKIQREISQNRRRTLTSGDLSRRHTAQRDYFHHSSHTPIGIDVQMAIKHHRMPKVLQRAKREMQRAEAEKPVKRVVEGFDIDSLEHEANGYPNEMNLVVVDGPADGEISPHREEDLEPEEMQVDLNLTHQLIAPDKVQIPERLLEYEDVVLTPAQEHLKQRKINAIENMLARSGHQAPRPTVHLAAALAAEAGTVARAVAQHAQHRAIDPSIV